MFLLFQPAIPVEIVPALTYLSTGGAAVVAAMLVSWIAEHVPQFGALKPEMKMAIQLWASAVLGVGAYYLLNFQPALVNQLAPWFGAFIGAVGPVMANKAWHETVNK